MGKKKSLKLSQRKFFDESPEIFQLKKGELEQGSKKFWNQRYSLFSRFDEGVYMNQELWYSVTPESIAIFISKFIYACNPNIETICDVFCGGGGNTIQFARRFKNVIGIDINQENLYCTEKNCEVYGVEHKVKLYLGDWREISKGGKTFKKLQKKIDFLFASPPWGGTSYKNKELFDLNDLQPLPIKELLESFFSISKNVCLFLPRNSDISQLSEITRELLGNDALCRILYTYSEGFIKGIMVFWGDSYMPEMEIDRDLLSKQNKAFIDETFGPKPDENFYDENTHNDAITNYSYLAYKNRESSYNSDIYINEYDHGKNTHGESLDQDGEGHHTFYGDRPYEQYNHFPNNESTYEKEYEVDSKPWGTANKQEDMEKGPQIEYEYRQQGLELPPQMTNLSSLSTSHTNTEESPRSAYPTNSNSHDNQQSVTTKSHHPHSAYFNYVNYDYNREDYSSNEHPKKQNTRDLQESHKEESHKEERNPYNAYQKNHNGNEHVDYEKHKLRDLDIEMEDHSVGTTRDSELPDSRSEDDKFVSAEEYNSAQNI
ncbi:hypothetical protein WICMUC_001420 [Wickerhamomyces mucosus]|uniref:Trimethylguanosine synthase n=1 Tax=Wickerhamomyces mucosus TaxID=1378264 RepID=A0A9P8PU13_9ASCO|nr:hypothetical protein WICMUC_001420 [Wickerhamomyces mucosus]